VQLEAFHRDEEISRAAAIDKNNLYNKDYIFLLYYEKCATHIAQRAIIGEKNIGLLTENPNAESIEVLL